MREKLKQTYRTAWRWPEAYGESKDLIYIGRALTIAVPVGIVALSFFTTIATLGILLSALFAGAVAVALVFLTIVLFHDEYPTVEEYETHEDRIKKFFHGFPSYTDVPLIENGDREWIAYGHVDPFRFVSAISIILECVSNDPDEAEHALWLEDRVEHTYATFNHPSEDFWNEGITICTVDTSKCFPITRVKDD
ncbi:membrane protein [Arthrobacter phage Mimi]|nr:hypothetical protein PBI_MIMI_147 [Arthrobacter phage Mimi]